MSLDDQKDQINIKETHVMRVRNLVFVFAMLVSLNLLAQTKQASAENFCKSIDVNGQVVDKEWSAVIKQTCANDANPNFILCRWFDINEQDGKVVVNKDKIESVIDFCDRYYSFANDTKIKKEEERPWYFAFIRHDWSIPHYRR